MASDDVNVKLCQQYVIKLDLKIRALIQDIMNCKGPIDVLEDLNQTVAGKIKELKSRLEELEKLAKEQDSETSKVALLREVDGYRKQLTSLQTLLRKANFICQTTIENKEKEQLFEGGSEVRHRGTMNKQAMANTTVGLTENLMSLSRMMSAQVERSEQTMNTLVSSSRVVGDTQEELKSMGGHIQSSHKLLTKYGRREWTDRLLIILAVAFFFATVFYIVKERMFSASDEDTASV